MENRRVSIIIFILLYLSILPATRSTDNIITAIDGTSYNYYYGADDGATRYKCPTAIYWILEVGDRRYTTSRYCDTNSLGLHVIYFLQKNSYKFDNYTLSCYDENDVRQATIYINIIDARRIHISYTYPTHSDTITSSNSTVPYEIPPLAQDIRISCAMEGCGWGDSRTRPVSYYNISVMSIKENTVITSYYKYFDNAADTTADIYKLLQIAIMVTGSTFAIKNSTTSYSHLPAYSEITTTSNITLACATDQTPVVSDSIQWYYTSTDAQNRIASTDSRLSLNTSTGISTLAVVINGTYICRVNVKEGSSFRTNEYTITISGSISVPISSQTTSISTTAKQISTAIASTTIPATLQVTTAGVKTLSSLYTNITSSTVPTTQQSTKETSNHSIFSSPPRSDSTTVSTTKLVLSDTSTPQLQGITSITTTKGSDRSVLIICHFLHQPSQYDTITIIYRALSETSDIIEEHSAETNCDNECYTDSVFSYLLKNLLQATDYSIEVAINSQTNTATKSVIYYPNASLNVKSNFIKDNIIPIAIVSSLVLFCILFLSLLSLVLFITTLVYRKKAKNRNNKSAYNEVPTTAEGTDKVTSARSDYEYTTERDSKNYYQVPEEFLTSDFTNGQEDYPSTSARVYYELNFSNK